MPELAIVIPTLGRSEKLGPLVENITKTTPEFMVLFVLDPDDEPSWEVVGELIKRNPAVSAYEKGGTLAVKTNAGVRATSEPWVLLAGDDVYFHPGWYEAAMSRAEEGIGVIGTNDLHNPAVQRGEYATQILIARWYVEKGTIDGPGVLHEGYHHNCVDVELCETAMARDAYAHAHNSIIEHLHPLWGKGDMDATYERGGFANVDADEALLRERRALWASLAA